jgi:AbrB family looped-hinge helix DNA binding protein
MDNENIINEPIQQYRAHIYSNGRINLPSQLRKTANLKDGDELILSFKDNTIYVQPMDQVIAEAQNLVAKYFAEDDLLKDLKTMRTLDAKLETEKYNKN